MTALMPQAMALEDRNIQDTLDLSESRAHDAALDILAAHKLTGNFRRIEAGAKCENGFIISAHRHSWNQIPIAA